jgi:hypothetical protein
MATHTRLLELALKGLEAERTRIETEIADLRGQLRTGTATPMRSVVAAQPRAGRRGGLTPAGRKKISDMMKARWAARRLTVQAGAPAKSAKPAKAAKPAGRGRLSPAGRKAISEAMKRRWAERRKKMAKAA